VVDKGTNTECVFQPDRSAAVRRPLCGASVKRSQTFSPSAAAHRADYICRLNRSDSDSSMPLYRRCHGPFQRDAIERRSLRWRAAPLAASAAALSCLAGAANGHHAAAAASLLGEMTGAAAARDAARASRRAAKSRSLVRPGPLSSMTLLRSSRVAPLCVDDDC